MADRHVDCRIPFTVALGLLVIVATSLAAADTSTPRPGTAEWLAIDGGRAIDCPVATVGIDAAARSRCIETTITAKEFKRHVNRLLHREDRTRLVRREGWRRNDGALWNRVLVRGAYFDVIHTDGMVVLTTAPSCLERRDDIHDWTNLDELPERERNVRPEYPLAARQERAGGFAIIEGVIDTDGRVSEVCIAHERPQGLGFAAAATRAVLAWTYRPGMIDGEPVATRLATSVDFEIR